MWWAIDYIHTRNTDKDDQYSSIWRDHGQFMHTTVGLHNHDLFLTEQTQEMVVAKAMSTSMLAAQCLSDLKAET